MKHLFSIILILISVIILFSFIANYDYLNGYALLFTGNYIKSYAYFSQLLKEEPNDIASCLLCGDSMVKMGELERALDIFKYCNTFDIKVPFIGFKIKPITEILSKYNKILLDLKLSLPTPLSEGLIINGNEKKLEEIRTFIKNYGKTNQAKLSGIIEAFLFINNGNFEEAEKSLLYLKDNEPLKELKEYLLALTYFKSKNNNKFLNKTMEFIKKEKDSILTPYFYLLLAEHYHKEKLIESAISALLNSINNKFYPLEIINLIVKKALLLINELPSNKIKYYSDLIKILQTNRIPLNQNTKELLINDKLINTIQIDSLINIAVYLYDSNSCDILEKILKRGEDENVIEIKLIKAKCLYKNKNYNLAISEVEKILKNNKNKNIENEAKLIAIKSYIKIKDYEKANFILNDNDFNEDIICDLSSLKIYLLSLMGSEPYEFIEKILYKYPQKSCLQDLYTQLGSYYYSKNDFMSADKWYEKHIELISSNHVEKTFNSPSSFFWKWKITKDNKYLYYIINSYPYSYYAYIASKTLNKEVFKSSIFQLPLCFLVPDKNIITAENYERLGLLELSEREFRKYIEKFSLDEIAVDGLARVLYKKGKILEATKTLEELCIKKPLFFKKVIKSRGREILFPQLYKNEIEENAKTYEIDKNLIFSIIRQESRFTQNITSPSGAIGLMQIMPSTGKWISEKIGDKNFNELELYEPSKNILYGTWYLKYLKDKYKKPYLIASAYNGGPTNTDKWLNNFKGNDVDLFIELIEKDETRDYVKKVLFNYWIYNTIEKSETESVF